MSSILRFPKANPIRLVLRENSVSYNRKDVNNRFWHEISRPNSRSWKQKFEQDDTIYFQFHTSWDNNFAELVRALDRKVVYSDFIEEQMLFEDDDVMLFEDGTSMLFEGSADSLSDVIKENTTYDTREAEIALTGVPPGVYFVRVYGSHSDGNTYLAESEFIEIREEWKNTTLVKYYNNEPAYDIDYRSGVTFQFRVFADYFKPANENEYDNLVSSETVITKLRDQTIEQRVFEFLEMHPGWITEKFNIILGHDYKTVDDTEVIGSEKAPLDFEARGAAWSRPSVVIPLKTSNLQNRYDSGSRVLFS